MSNTIKALILAIAIVTIGGFASWKVAEQAMEKHNDEQQQLGALRVFAIGREHGSVVLNYKDKEGNDQTMRLLLTEDTLVDSQ